MTTATQDPFQSATEATVPSATYYAQIQCDAWFCVLVKGQGKVVFDPQQHPIDQRRTAINLSLAPISEQQVQFPLERQMIAESVEWAKIVWPSARALGITSARELHGKWAKVEIVGTGRKYEKRDKKTGEKTGEMGESTTFKFVALYPDEAAARVAYQAGAQGSEAAPAQPAAPAAGSNGNSKERETALAFLKVLIPQWGMDLDKVAAGIANNPVIARHFTAQSPEVIQLMAELAK